MAEAERLRAALDRKRHKLSEARRRAAEEAQALRSELRHREAVIQELLTLRMFLRASLEWVKASVAESFPRYNSLLYAAVFSDFGLLIANAFVDFMGLDDADASDSSGSGDSPSARVFWIPYIVWALAGLAGWLLDWRVSKRSALGPKLAKIQAATFGAVSPQSMREALSDNGSMGALLSPNAAAAAAFEPLYKLGCEVEV